ncbi:hypothetical protein AVEN_17336-1, partial [Araneus ventricosus]
YPGPESPVAAIITWVLKSVLEVRPAIGNVANITTPLLQYSQEKRDPYDIVTQPEAKFLRPTLRRGTEKRGGEERELNEGVQ